MALNEQLTPVAKSVDVVVHRAELIGGTGAGSAPAVGAPGLALTPGALLRALRRRLILALAVGVVLAAVAATAVWVYLPPPKPRVSAKLYVDYSQRGTLFEHPDSPLNQQTQINVLKSEAVITAALRNPEVNKTELISQQADPVDWLAKELMVDYPSGDEIVRISLVTMQTDDGVKIVDAVKTAYLDEFVNKSAKARRQRLDRLQALQTTAHESLKRKQATVRKLAEAVGSTRPENVAMQQQLAHEQYGTAQREYVKLQSDLRRLRLEESSLKAGAVVPRTPAESAIKQYVDSDPVVKDLEKRQAQIEARVRETERVATKAVAEVAAKKAQDDLTALSKDLKEARAKARVDYTTGVAQLSELESKTRVTQLSEQIAFQEELGKVLVTEIDRLGKSIKSINTANLDLEAEKIEIQTAEDLYAKVAAAISTHLAENDAPSRVAHLENARVERVNTEARKMQFAGFAGAAALGFVCLVVSLFEFRNQRVDSIASVGLATGLPTLGTIPWFPSNVHRQSGVKKEYWHSVLTESMASTQMFLRHAGNVGLPRILLIASAEKGEGKTLLSTHLAAGFARNGVKTLLIDGDLRKPSAHGAFGVPSGPGLAELLRDEVLDRDVIREVRANLFFIPAGACDDASLCALARGVLAADFRRFLSDYEVVIIDSSPLMLVADALHFAKRADGVILTVRNDYSRVALVQETVRRLRQIAAPLLGVVVNGYTHGGSGYGYGYGYNRLAAAKTVEVEVKAEAR
ncbi:tyrosine-protein kinase domain-containing protein [Limnoglobus roseus]|uniref:Exopolysaccharide biosynthesis protein n=1 Tax=Limnoglobus roseus TaxID=2598579 RepID=A0A5C1AAF0_9BACT|nr:CpsD/CapB family tyrosine-protein kinase [Limnoglobus roseus]QEL15545.1 exopolysaccharide biosynthesis protein [Limnoglobus roseus]